MHSMQDEAAVRQLVKDCVRAWNKQDSIACGQPFAENACYRMVYGQKLQGRACIVQGIMEADCKGSHLDTQIESVRFVQSDVACIEVVSRLSNIDSPFERVISTIVAVKQVDIWRIVTFNNAGILRAT